MQSFADNDHTITLITSKQPHERLMLHVTYELILPFTISSEYITKVMKNTIE